MILGDSFKHVFESADDWSQQLMLRRQLYENTGASLSGSLNWQITWAIYSSIENSLWRSLYDILKRDLII